jgi:hypothetical protein
MTQKASTNNGQLNDKALIEEMNQILSDSAITDKLEISIEKDLLENHSAYTPGLRVGITIRKINGDVKAILLQLIGLLQNPNVKLVTIGKLDLP